VLTNSVALLADLIHNFGDALTAVPVGIVRDGGKPEDRERNADCTQALARALDRGID
jgi:hypothetical protein